MGLRINNNIESMVAHRNLLKNERELSKSLERLASGQKVNRAADDPAALVISEHMRSQINGKVPLQDITRSLRDLCFLASQHFNA